MRYDSTPPLSQVEAALKEFQGRALYLQFPGETEEAFQQARAVARLKHFRWAAFLGLLLYNAFLILDSLLLDVDFRWCMLVRLGIVTPLALATLALISLPGVRWR